MARLDDGALQSVLAQLPGWSRDGNALAKEFRFQGFRPGIHFVNRIADVADAVDHHPDLEIGYGRVKVSLSTHDEGGITDLDVDLARRIEQVVGD